jgi:PAS domain S-box-containing protein
VQDELVLVGYNAPAVEITGGAVEDHVGTTARELFRERPSVLSLMRRTIREKRSFQQEISYRFRATGRVHDLGVTYVFVPPDLVVVHAEDVTATREEIRAQLRALSRLRRIFEHLPDGVLALRKGEVIYANPGLSHLLGARREEIEGVPLWVWVHPDDREKLDRCQRRPELLGEPDPFDLRLGSEASGWREVECFSSSFSLEGEPVVVGVIRDRSKRKRRDRELADHRTRLEQSQRLARLAYWEWDAETDTVTYGPEGFRMLGLDPGRWDGRLDSAVALVHPHDRARVEEAIAGVLEGGSSRYEVRHRVRREDGRVVSIQVLGEVERGEDGRLLRVHGAFQDVTELREKERALEVSERRLRALAQRAGEELEAERKRISRDLHDHLGQSTLTLRMQLLYLRTLVEEAGVGREATATIDEAVEEMELMMEWSRRLSRELRPDLLDRLGLASALRWQLGQIEERTGLRVSLDLAGLDREPPEEVAVALFRIAQEAGRNVVRHAAARTLSLHLRFGDGAWTMVVRDDGRGMDAGAKERGLGILGMKEQAVGVGGRLELVSRPGAGTRLEVTVPESRRDPGEHA